MKRFALKLAGLGLALTALFFTSCGDDPVVVDPLGPDVQLVSDPGFLSGDSEVIINEGFSVKVRLSTGDAQLQSLAIDAGNDKLETTRFTINGGAVTSNNPLLITGADKDGVTYTIDIIPSGTEQVGDMTTFTFTVTSDDGETAFKEIVITTADVPGTPLDMTINGVLLNQAGEAGTGGLDLDTGVGTGSSDATAELRDMGIDCNISLPAENWVAQFGTANGAEMVKVDRSQLENFSFDNVSLKETILDVFTNNSTALSDGLSEAPDCTETAVTDVSGELTVGDLFIVFANDTYYMIRVDEINFVSDDPGTTDNENNFDNYVFSIKY